MKPDISFLQYMKAHGNTPSPTQRPLLTGAASGLAAGIPSAAVLYFSGAAGSVDRITGIGISPLIFVHILLIILAGILYAQIFKRAANDRKGGWLFGAGYGFLLWVIGPISIWQALSGVPVAVGTAAKGVFGACILYGLILGSLFPLIHSLIHLKWSNALTKTVENPPYTEKTRIEEGTGKYVE